MKPLTWSFGMQSRGGSRLGERPDIDGAVAALAETEARDAIVFAKDHTGFCFYPTKVGIVHPKLKVNLTGEMTEALHKRNMKSIAYFNIGMDGEAARAHENYRKYSAPGVTLLTEDHYAEVCIFGPCYEEYILPLVKEIFLVNKVDGIFFDPTGCFNYCCCETCKADFLQETGMELIPPEEHPENIEYWTAYENFLKNRIRNFIGKIRAEIHKIAPQASIVFNHTGGPGGQDCDAPGVRDKGGISCDPIAAHPLIPMYANYTSSLPEKGDVFIERFARGWGDRSNLDDFSLSHKCASVFMYDVRLCIGDRLHPDCSLAPGAGRAMKVIYKLWKEMKDLMGNHAEINPDILCLIPQMYRRFGGNRGTRLGAYRMLVDCGRSFMVTPELMLNDKLQPDKLLIVPDLRWMKKHVEESIRAFVKAGGKVLFTEHVPILDDDTIPDFMGISSVEKIPYQPCVYLPDWDNERPLDMEKPLVEGDVHRITLSTAQTEIFGIPQYDLARMGAGYNSSADKAWDVPLLTRNRYGKGDVFFLNAPILSDYQSGHGDLLCWMRLLLRNIYPESSVELLSQGGNVELSSYRCGAQESMHILVNHGGLQTSSSSPFYCEKTLEPQPAYPVILKQRCASGKAEVSINGKMAEYQTESGHILVPLTMDTLWKIVRIKEL